MSEFKNGYMFEKDGREFMVVGYVCKSKKTAKRTVAIIHRPSGFITMVKESSIPKPMGKEEKAGKEIFDLCQGLCDEIMGSKYDKWECLRDSEKKIWIEVAKKVTINK